MDSDSPRIQRLLLDGATATNLFARSMPLEGCHEDWILKNATAFQSLQREFLKAGSGLLLTPTFSANRTMLARHGHEKEVFEYNLRLAQLTLETAEGQALAGGNLSPTGLSFSPAGEVSFDELVDIYAEQANALNEAGVDCFYIETMLTVTESRAAVLACRPYGKPVYVSAALKEDGMLFSDASPLAALLSLQGLGLAGFGFNCASPSLIAGALREIAPFSHLPLLAKPNAGNPNPLYPGLYELSPDILAGMCEELLDAGATILGGCCGTTPAHVAALGKKLREYVPAPLPAEMDPQDYDIYLTNTSEVFQLDNDRLEFTDPIFCSLDMAEELLAAEESAADVLHIEIETPEDALAFPQNEHLARLPVCFRSDNEIALDRALFLYNGRCMVDRECAIEEDTLQTLASRYGAVLY